MSFRKETVQADLLQLTPTTQPPLGRSNAPTTGGLFFDAGTNQFLGVINGQLTPLGGAVVFAGTPIGACSPNQIAVNSGTGALYSCSAGSWVQIGPTAGSLVSPVTSPNPLGFDVNVNFKGPNPYTDVTRYGVRAVNQTIAPAIPGITVNITSGSASATISSASTFQNGDGVVVFGAGAPHSMTTPVGLTVTPSVAAGGTGTGVVANGPAGGATTYNYQVVARDKNGGLTAAGTVASTTTGAASLGAQSVACSGFTRSGSTVTATTSSAHGLSVGSMVYVFCTNNSDNYNFGGWYVVTTVADTTHFSYITGLDAAAGAATSSGSTGTANWFNCNHLSWTAVTGASQYYIYGRTGGSLTLLGVSRLQSAGQGILDTTWDDFGSPMMDGVLLPYFVPSTPPGAATSDSLVTTIVSGAGTTGLTLAATAGTSVSGATILFDNAPNILTAASAAAGNGLLYFPAGGSYVVNSYVVLPTNLAISQAGTIWLNDTIETGSTTRWYGNLGPQGAPEPQFGWPAGNSIFVNRANPGIYGTFAGYFQSIQFTVQGDSGVAQMADNYTQSSWKYVNFSCPGYMSMGLIMRSNGAVGFSDMDHVAFITGPSQVNGSSATPALFFDGNMHFDSISLSRRGIYTKIGSGFDISFGGMSRFQGGIMPFFSISNSTGGTAGGSLSFQNIELDTMAHAIVANLFSPATTNVGSIRIRGGNGPSLSFGFVTGKPFGSVDASIVAGGSTGQNNNSILTFSTVTFANLGTPPNGALAFCPDCTVANPCASGGTGALAKRLNGIWVCN